MSRLIDADKLIKELHEALDGSGYDEDYKDMGIDDFIMSQPTAYDVEKVVAELEEWTFNADINIGDGTIMNHNLITSKNAIDIVRKGGVE